MPPDMNAAATKGDLEEFGARLLAQLRGEFGSKSDLDRFATKDDLDRFATKEDLERFATKEDLERFATKEDLADLRVELKADTDRVMMFVMGERTHREAFEQRIEAKFDDFKASLHDFVVDYGTKRMRAERALVGDRLTKLEGRVKALEGRRRRTGRA